MLEIQIFQTVAVRGWGSGYVWTKAKSAAASCPSLLNYFTLFGPNCPCASTSELELNMLLPLQSNLFARGVYCDGHGL